MSRPTRKDYASGTLHRCPSRIALGYWNEIDDTRCSRRISFEVQESSLLSLPHNRVAKYRHRQCLNAIFSAWNLIPRPSSHSQYPLEREVVSVTFKKWRPACGALHSHIKSPPPQSRQRATRRSLRRAPPIDRTLLLTRNLSRKMPPRKQRLRSSPSQPAHRTNEGRTQQRGLILTFSHSPSFGGIPRTAEGDSRSRGTTARG
jgi:hypothetical protein